MSAVLRLALVSHAATDATREARFPADEPLNGVGRREVERCAVMTADRVLVAPEARTAQTAAALGLTPTVDAALRDLDYAAWRGERMDDVPQEKLAVWLTEPAAAPHGGESIVALIERVRQWLNGITESPVSTLAVTHPAVVRAAVLVTLDSPPESFWRIDVAPLGITRLHWRGRWTLRQTGYDYPKLTP